MSMKPFLVRPSTVSASFCLNRRYSFFLTYTQVTMATHIDTTRNSDVTLQDIYDAADRLRNYASVTPVMTSRRLDEMTAKNLYFKCELFQRTGSFKYRGAINAVRRVLEEHTIEHKPSIVTHSSGNHGQAIACAAQQMGTKAYVVVPNTASEAKRKAIETYGATVITSDPEYKEREAHVAFITKSTGAVYIPTSQNHDVVAGQGTIGLEFLDQMLEFKVLDAIVASVSGGGMVAGIGRAAKEKQTAIFRAIQDFTEESTIQPGIKIIAAEPENADDIYRSFRANRLLKNSKCPNTIADALTGNMGPVTWPILQDVLDDVITVSEEQIKDATKLVWETMKLCIEPSAGVAVAAVLSDKFISHDLKNIGIILCGGNVDFESISKWIV